jgi:hypothetical protein
VTFFALGWAYWLYTFIDYHRLSLVSAALWSAAVIIFLIGLISEQITALTYRRDG